MTTVIINNLNYTISNNILQEIPLFSYHIDSKDIHINFDITDGDIQKLLKKLYDKDYNNNKVIYYNINSIKKLDELHNILLFCEYLCINFKYVITNTLVLAYMIKNKDKYIYYLNYKLSINNIDYICINDYFLTDGKVSKDIMYSNKSIIYYGEKIDGLLHFLNEKVNNYNRSSLCKRITLKMNIKLAIKKVINYGFSLSVEKTIVQYLLLRQRNNKKLFVNENDIDEVSKKYNIDGKRLFVICNVSPCTIMYNNKYIKKSGSNDLINNCISPDILFLSNIIDIYYNEWRYMAKIIFL